ncbi:MAG: TlpA family protein disulfide reductase [Planctomycetota bacterium]|jgi:peroxiredoxin
MSRRSLIAAFALALIALPAAPLLAEGGAKRKPADARKDRREKRQVRKVGDTVESLSLSLAGGGTWKLASAGKKPVVLVFASKASKESLDALRELGKVDGPVAKSGAVTLGVLRDVKAKAAAKLAKNEKVTVTLAVDPKRKTYDRFARSGLPYTVVLDKDRKIVHSGAGFDAKALAKLISKGSERD